MFTNKDLRNLIIPLFIEQFLLMFVGIADTFAVSFSSEADVSGISLVTSFNTVLIFLFTALSSGGAVPQHWENRCDYEYFDCRQCDQCDRQLRRSVCFEDVSGGRSLSVVPFQGTFCRYGYGLLL